MIGETLWTYLNQIVKYEASQFPIHFCDVNIKRYVVNKKYDKNLDTMFDAIVPFVTYKGIKLSVLEWMNWFFWLKNHGSCHKNSNEYKKFFKVIQASYIQKGDSKSSLVCTKSSLINFKSSSGR